MRGQGDGRQHAVDRGTKQPPKAAHSPSTVYRLPPAAFTLFEVVLVLVVMVGLLGIAWPSLNRIHDHHRLRQSGELVQVRLMAARVRALETGLIYQFCFEPNGRRFIAAPLEQDPANSGGTAPASAVAGMLKAGVSFEAGSWGTGVPISEVVLNRLPDAAEYQGLTCAGPILFYPDGTALAPAPLVLRSDKQHAVQLTVRSLTGGVTLAATE